MGKKIKDYDKMDFHEKKGYLRSQAAHYGVIPPDSDVNNHHDALMSHTGLNLEDSVVQAMNNNYNVRESLKYGVESGNKHFKGLGTSVDSMTAAVGAHQAMMNYAKKDLKHKNTTSVNDFADIPNRLFEDSRNKFQGNIEDKVTNDINGIRDEIEENRGIQEQSEVDPQSFEHSDAVSKAKDNLEKYKLNLGSSNLFSKENEAAPRADDQKDATRTFAGSYITDVKEASNLGENKAQNLNNAANVVASYRR